MTADNLEAKKVFKEGDIVLWSSRKRHGYENEHTATVIRQSGQRVKIKIALDPVLPGKYYVTYVKPENVRHAP